MAQNSIDLFSLLPTSHNYYSGVIRSIPSIMASERLNLPPVPSVARITQSANEDTALFILQPVLKTGAHLPSVKWHSLVKLLWDPPPNSGPFYPVFREWTASGHSRNIRLLVDAILRHYGEFDTIENPYPSTIQALARRLSSEASVATLEDRQRRDADTCRMQAHSLLKMTIRRARLACSQKGQALTHRMCVVHFPRISKSSRMHAQFWPRIRGPPTRTSVLWCRVVILPALLYQ